MEWVVGSSSHHTEGVQGSVCCIVVSSESKTSHLGAKPIQTQDVQREVIQDILKQYV